MRELPDADAIDVLFIARPGGAVASPEQALSHEGSGLFVRPVDVPALVKKVEVLTGGAVAEADGLSAGEAGDPGTTGTRASAPPSLPPASMRSPESMAAAPRRPPSARPPRMPSEPPTSAASQALGARKLVGLAAPVSRELQQLLADAEHRAQVGSANESVIPSPEDEIEAVLPAELLAALDEPLAQDEDEDELAPRSAMFGTAAREPTDGGGRTTGAPTTGVGATGEHTPRPIGGAPFPSDIGVTPAPPVTHGGTGTGLTGPGVSTSSGADGRDAGTPSSSSHEEPSGERPPTLPPATAWSPSVPARAEISVPPVSGRIEGPGGGFPTVLGPGDALRVIARAVGERTTGSLCFASNDAERRLVLREGDVVTASSTGEDESLLGFLGTRGDLPKETVRRLEAKFPPFGRHAGAALVARGYLRQDQMWPTLRAHAEWVIARVLQASQARLIIEADPPGRLASEPSVFGGAPGASVFVEMIRRIVPPADALERLGGLASRLADGPAASLFAECGLGTTEVEQLRTMAGRSLRDFLDGAPEGDMATVLFALAQLRVVDVLRSAGVQADAGDGARASDAEVAAIDVEAVRERVRARLQLVEDGDYFALLGVSHDATGYEVRRAFLELRRAFDPSRVLTPEVADLAEAVRQITMVLEEAYDILKDAARRERYRRAIEAVPGN